MPFYRVMGTYKVERYVHIDEVVEAEDEADAIEIAGDDVNMAESEDESGWVNATAELTDADYDDQDDGEDTDEDEEG